MDRSSAVRRPTLPPFGDYISIYVIQRAVSNKTAVAIH